MGENVERCTIGSKKGNNCKFLDWFKKKIILAKSPLCHLQNAPDYTGILPAVPFLFKVESYHVTSVNISEFKKADF